MEMEQRALQLVEQVKPQNIVAEQRGEALQAIKESEDFKKAAKQLYEKSVQEDFRAEALKIKDKELQNEYDRYALDKK